MKCDCGGEAIWEHPKPGIGVATCQECGWIVAAYNCPYIPVEFVKEKNNDRQD